MRQRKQRTAQQRTKQQKKHKTIDYTFRGLDIAMIKNVAKYFGNINTATGSTGKNTLVLSFTIDWSEKNEVCHQT